MSTWFWPGMIKDHLLDLTPCKNGIEKTHFPSIVANNTVSGKLIAMPWFTDAGLLYYRNLLEEYGEKASTYSKQPKVAADMVIYLTSKEIQKERAINGSFTPTIPELYKDKEVLEATPFFGTLYEVFTSAVPRPSTVTGLEIQRRQSGVLERDKRWAGGPGTGPNRA